MSHTSDDDFIPAPAYHDGPVSVAYVCRSVRSLLSKLIEQQTITDSCRMLMAQAEHALCSCVETLEAIGPVRIGGGRGCFTCGDFVKVWSLQSFHGGGFIEGSPGFILSGNEKGESSVIVAVCRKINGVFAVDEAYEVYVKQVEPCSESEWNKNATNDLKKYYKSQPWLRK